MKTTFKVIEVIIIAVMIISVLSSCNEYKEFVGTYEANTHFERDWELGDSGKKVKIENDITAELILGEDGIYTYECFNVEGGDKFESHYQKGEYKILDGEITLMPSEHWVKGDKGGVWKTAQMTAEETEKWTVKGKFNEGAVKLSLPWYFSYPDAPIDQEFKLVASADE